MQRWVSGVIYSGFEAVCRQVFERFLCPILTTINKTSLSHNSWDEDVLQARNSLNCYVSRKGNRQLSAEVTEDQIFYLLLILDSLLMVLTSLMSGLGFSFLLIFIPFVLCTDSVFPNRKI